MKILIYGIDGGDLEIMKKFPMPFLKKFIKENHGIELESDLVNRGWAEILTGQGSHQTGAFYMHPTLNGTHEFSTSFNFSKLANRSDIIPLWNVFEKHSLPFLIMNVPTTTPAPSVRGGFVIGSAGGGLNQIEGIPESLVSDRNLIPLLEKHNYIVDIRIPNTDFEDTKDLLDALVSMEERRTKCFIDICKERHIEAGFLVNRGTTIIEYLARSEIEHYDKNNRNQNWIHKKLEEHYAMLDTQMEQLHSKLKPEHFIITADHGMVPHKERADLNVFLIQSGYLHRKSNCSSWKILKRISSALHLNKASRKVFSQLPSNLKESANDFDFKKSTAFHNRHTLGIYINDQKRFNGPVTEEAIPNLLKDICSKFNKMPEAQSLKLKAVPYRSLGKFKGATYREKLPDIKIENAEGIVSNSATRTILDNNQYNTFLQPNPSYGPIPQKLNETHNKPFTGDKGAHPICLMSKSAIKHIAGGDNRDLTLVYKVVARIAESANIKKTNKT